MYLNNFNLIDKKNKNIDLNFVKVNSNIYNFLNNNKNLIVIIHSRFSMRLLETLFDNEEGGAEYFKNEDKFIGTYLQPIFINESTREEREKYLAAGIISSVREGLDQ